jgi:hypothetical protein
MVLLSKIELKDAYRISLSFLCLALAVAEFIGGLFSPEKIQDNAYILGVLLAIMIEGTMILITHYLSKKHL